MELEFFCEFENFVHASAVMDIMGKDKTEIFVILYMCLCILLYYSVIVVYIKSVFCVSIMNYKFIFMIFCTKRITIVI